MNKEIDNQWMECNQILEELKNLSFGLRPEPVILRRVNIMKTMRISEPKMGTFKKTLQDLRIER